MEQKLRKKEVKIFLNPVTDFNFVDLRSDEERQIEREAYREASLGPEADPLVEELIEIGQTYTFISDPGGNFNKNGQHIRTREIGDTLDRMGGIELMQAAYYRILAVLGLTCARSLECAWGHIGEWLP
jgi:hypothetical protein